MHSESVRQPRVCAVLISTPAPCSPQVPLNEYEFPTSKLANVQSQLERLVEKNYYLHQVCAVRVRGCMSVYAARACACVCVGGGVMCQLERLVEKNYYLHQVRSMARGWYQEQTW